MTARPAIGACLLLSLLSIGLPASLYGQLRPLPPLDWTLFEGNRVVTSAVGAGVFLDQRASLAGTSGTLLELGEFALGVRSGRLAIEVGGTVLRLFEDEDRFATPFGGAQDQAGPNRRDAGDFRVSTLVRLTPEDEHALALLRFGTRLPTTDNEVGLERDRTDFFALLAGRYRRGDGWIAAEAGVGINGTHDSQLEQSDVLTYSATAGYRKGWFSPRVTLVGHMDGMRGLAIRGNEELSELRAGARMGEELWVEIEAVHGLQPFSPRAGFLLRVGTTR